MKKKLLSILSTTMLYFALLIPVLSLPLCNDSSSLPPQIDNDGFEAIVCDELPYKEKK